MPQTMVITKLSCRQLAITGSWRTLPRRCIRLLRVGGGGTVRGSGDPMPPLAVSVLAPRQTRVLYTRSGLATGGITSELEWCVHFSWLFRINRLRTFSLQNIESTILIRIFFCHRYLAACTGRPAATRRHSEIRFSFKSVTTVNTLPGNSQCSLQHHVLTINRPWRSELAIPKG
jgi:hypothetical protein